METALEGGASLEKIKVDLKASLIKPLYGNWLIAAVSILESRTATLVRGFEAAGIINCFDTP